MKLKKRLTPIIISIILICIPAEVCAWLAKDTYEACNIVNVCISGFMKMMAFIVSISYITIVIKYIKYSKQERKQKIRNILIWLIITIIQVAVLIIGALGVTEVGMEEYWYRTGERYQSSAINGYISNAIRIIVFVLIVFYIIKSIVYWVQSEKENKQKLKNLIKWQIITAIIVVGLLLLARNW